MFDEDHFINSLANDVRIVKKLPKELASATKVVKNFRSWSGVDYYKKEIASLWDEYQVFHIEAESGFLIYGFRTRMFFIYGL